MTVGRRIAGGFGISVALKVTIGAAALFCTLRLLDTAKWVTHTHQVLENLESVSAKLTQSESAVRGYLISGDQGFLDIYQASRSAVGSKVALIRTLTSDNPAQEKRLDSLESHIEARFAFMKKTLQTRTVKGLSTDAAVLVSEGRDLTQTILQAVSEMELAEQTLLNQREQSAKTTATWTIYMIAFGTVLAVAFIVATGLIVHRSITRPLAEFKEFVGNVGRGDLTQRSTISGTDEFQELASSLNGMVDGLRGVASQTRQVAEHLNAVTAEILASAKQQAASTGEQAAAVHQTNATMQELTQSGIQISERAKHVARIAQATSQASTAGTEAVHGTAQTMQAIREQSEAVAENIVTLSERTQIVGEIIAAVNDIAEQSHLLSLNAAIEAASAGEHGRSFSVIASEIKNLADRSKSATVQVRSILVEIQKGINSSVMLTEEAVKRVESGRQQADMTARTIRELTENIDQSVQAFQQILAGTNQQQIGFEQVTLAVRDIGQASNQTASSVRQLEGASTHLTTLGQQLRTVVEQYKL